MPEPLPVHVSRSERHAIETVESFEAAGPFVVEVTNHGGDAHVHLRLDEGLAGAARIEGDGNVYVENGETRRVRVETTPDGGGATGTLTVETGYGAEGVGIDVALRDPAADEPAAEASVGTTASDDPEPAGGSGGAGGTGGGLDAPTVPGGTLPVAGLALLALGIAALTAMTLESPVVVAGVVVVLVAVVVAAALLVR